MAHRRRTLLSHLQVQTLHSPTGQLLHHLFGKEDAKKCTPREELGTHLSLPIQTASAAVPVQDRGRTESLPLSPPTCHTHKIQVSKH